MGFETISQQKEFLIGRKREEVDILIPDKSISRIHAQIKISKNGKVYLKDKNSSNGTKVIRNNKEYKLGNSYNEILFSDKIVFGKQKITFRELQKIIKEKLEMMNLLKPKNEVSGNQVSDNNEPKEKRLSGDLVRCHCGAIKERNSICEVCGE